MVFRPIELTTGTLIFCKWDLASTEAVHSNPLRKRVPVSSSKGIGTHHAILDALYQAASRVRYDCSGCTLEPAS